MAEKAELRQFIMSYFSDEELDTLCFDYFREVLNNFTANMTKSQKVISLIGYCERRDLMENLHASLATLRPEPYRELIGSPPVFHPKERVEGRSPNRIFLSHANQDAGFAQQLADDLRRHEYDVWMAPNSIEPGEKWVEAIERGLETSGIFLLVMTPTAAKSKWVKDESNYAIELENQGEVRFITLDVAEGKMPPMWRLRQNIPFRQDYDDGLSQLLKALQPTKSNRAAMSARPAKPTSSSRTPRWIPIMFGLTIVLSAVALFRGLLPPIGNATPSPSTEPVVAVEVTQPPTTVVTVVHTATSRPAEPATIMPAPTSTSNPTIPTIEPADTLAATQPPSSPIVVVVTAPPQPTNPLPTVAADTPIPTATFTPTSTFTPTASSTATETPTPTGTSTRILISSIYDIPINRDRPAIPNTEYNGIRDIADAIYVAVPIKWDDVDPANWTDNGTVVGSQLLAAPDIDGFNATYTTPGVRIFASARLGGQDMGTLVDGYYDVFSRDCAFEGQYDYEDQAYTGVLDHYINCEELGGRLIVLAAEPADRAYGLILFAQAASEADFHALDTLLKTFSVDGSALPGQ